MDLYKTIRELHEEKRRLDGVIQSLEVLLSENNAIAALPVAGRRGRKGMSSEERREVSARMKKYWEARRRQQNQSGKANRNSQE